MKRIKLVIATILILALSFTAYTYFRKRPVENIPNRATLVLNIYKDIEKEGDIYAELEI